MYFIAYLQFIRYCMPKESNTSRSKRWHRKRNKWRKRFQTHFEVYGHQYKKYIWHKFEAYIFSCVFQKQQGGGFLHFKLKQ